MRQRDFRKQKIEPREKTDYKKYDQRIRKCKQKSLQYIPSVGRTGGIGFLERACRIGPEKINTEHYKHHTAYDLDGILIRFQKFFYKRKPETCKKTIKKIGKRRTYTGKKTGVSAFLEGTLHT